MNQDAAAGRLGLVDSLLIYAAGLAFFLPAIASRDLWQPLETRYATVAREMAATGDWLIPRINGEHYQDKPPLFFWLGAVLWKCGVGPEGVRVTSALAGAGTLVVLAALARFWFSRRAALLAAGVLATTPEFGWLARFGELDVTLTFFTTLSVYGWFAGGRKVALFYLGIGLAVMVKGPPGLLVPVVAAIAGHLARVAPASPRAPLHPAWGTLVAALPGACWFVPALIEAGTPYAKELLGRHMLGRVADSWQHKQPFYFYLNEASLNFLPWLPLVVPAGIRAWRRRRDEPALAMLLGWLLLGLLAFSAVSGKRIAYILPLAAPFALLLARGAEALLVSGEPERRTARVHFVTHLVLAGTGLGLVVFGVLGNRFHAPKKPYIAEAIRPIAELPGGLAPAAAGLAIGAAAVLGARLVRRRRHLAGLWTMAATMALGFFSVDFIFVPRINGQLSPRPVALRMDDLVPRGTGEIGVFPARPPEFRGETQYAYSGAFNVYSERLLLVPLPDAAAATRFLEGPGRRLVVGSRKAVEEGFLELPPGVRRIRAGQVYRSEILLLANFEVPSLTPFNENR